MTLEKDESAADGVKTVDTSQSMVEAIVPGDYEQFEDGFRRFCVLCHLLIRRWCRRWFQTDADADDAAQEMILMLRKKLRMYKPRSNVRFRHWLSKVSKNAAIDICRSRKRTIETSDAFPALPLEDERFVSDLMMDFERRTLWRGSKCGNRIETGVLKAGWNR